MMKKYIPYNVLTCILIVSCVTLFILGGCSDNDDEQLVEKCGATDFIHMGEYVLVNDEEEHPGYAQCIFEDRREGTFGWTWEANSPATQQGDVATSAYIFYGYSAYGWGPTSIGEDSTTPALPVAIDDLAALTITYDVRVSTTSRYRLGISTSNTGCTVGFCASASLKIYLHSNSSSDSTNFQKRITIDGEEYDFYKDAYYVSSASWAVYWFVKVSPSDSGTLRIHKFLNFLDDEGYGESLLKIHSIEHIKFFQNMWEGGAGSTTIGKYSINVTPHVQ